MAGNYVRSDFSREDTFSLIAAAKKKHYNQSKLHELDRAFLQRKDSGRKHEVFNGDL